MDSATNLLDYSLVHVSETGSSVVMEKEGLRRCLDKLLDQGADIISYATNRHTGVTSLMKKCYPNIEHQYDGWQLAKSVTKKLTKKAQAKHHEQLFPWIQSISNHRCKGDAILIVEKWKSILHHISNVHEWDSDPNSLFPNCAHPILPPEELRSKKWLKSGSVAHNA